MGGMISNGLIVQLQRRADQESFLRAFWELRDSAKRSLKNAGNMLSDYPNEFTHDSPGFDSCSCHGPGMFYPQREIASQLDPQCMMRDDEIPTLWENLHEALHLLWNLLDKFDSLRKKNGSSFRVQYLQYNEHGAIDLLSWEIQDNKLFILYTICYLTLFPEAQGEQGFLEKFETAESFKEFLQDLKMNQFVKISPLLRVFFKTHDFGNRSNYFDSENDLENMIEFFFKRSYYEQISDTAFNVYTAAVVYGNSMQLKNFGEKRKRELEQLDQRKNQMKSKNTTTFLSNIPLANKHTKRVAHGIEVVAAQSQMLADKAYGMEQTTNAQLDRVNNIGQKNLSAVAPEPSKFQSDEELGEAKDNTPKAIATGSARIITHRDSIGSTDVEEVLKTALGKLAPQQNFFGKLMDRLSQGQTAKDRYISDYRSAIDKSIICFALQALLNLALLMMNPEEADWGDDSETTPINFRHTINCLIIIFTFYYVMTMSMTQFHIHTVSMVTAMKGKITKLLALANFLANTVLAMSLIYTTAVVLKRSSATVMDIVLNSTAIYFIVDLDDMMIGSTDEEILEERVLFTYIYNLITLSKQSEPGAVTQYLREERWWLIIQGYASILVLAYSFYAYFGTSFPHIIYF